MIQDAPTLFDYAAKGSSVPKADHYPVTPGYKKEGTSQLASASVRSEVKCLREKVLLCLRHKGPSTSDEIASWLGESILSIRPRCSELIALGKIRETNTRRPNRSGKMAAVLEIVSSNSFSPRPNESKVAFSGNSQKSIW